MGLFGGLGLTWAASRFPAAYGSVGKFEDLRAFLWWSIVTLAGVNSVLALLAYRARDWISEFYHTPALAKYVYLFVLIMFLGAMATFFGQLLSGYGNVARRTLIANFGGSSLTMLLTVALVSTGTGLWGYIFAQVLSAAAVLGALVWAAWRLTPLPARLSWSRPGALHTEIFSFAVASLAMDVAGFLSSQTDKVILGFFLTAKSVGVYAVAGAVVAFIPVALQSVNQIFSPTIAELHARGDSALLGRMFQVLTKWVLGLTLPLAVVVIVFARPVMRIFGHDFESGWLILVIGTIGQLVNCAVGSVGYLLLMSGNQNRLIRVQLVMAVGMVCLSVLLVPTLGVVGAALAAAASNAGTNALNLWEVKKVLGLFPYNRSYLRLGVPAILAVIAALALRAVLLAVRPDWLVVAGSGILVYGVFLVALVPFGFDDDDQLVLRAVWARFRSVMPAWWGTTDGNAP